MFGEVVALAVQIVPAREQERTIQSQSRDGQRAVLWTERLPKM